MPQHLYSLLRVFFLLVCILISACDNPSQTPHGTLPNNYLTNNLDQTKQSQQSNHIITASILRSNRENITYTISSENSFNEAIQAHQWEIIYGNTHTQEETTDNSIELSFPRSVSLITIRNKLIFENLNLSSTQTLIISPPKLVNFRGSIDISPYLYIEDEMINPSNSNNSKTLAENISPPISVIGSTQDRYNSKDQTPQDQIDYYRLSISGASVIYFKGEQFNHDIEQSIHRITLYNQNMVVLSERYAHAHNSEGIQLQTIPINNSGTYYLVIQDVGSNQSSANSSGQYVIDLLPTENLSQSPLQAQLSGIQQIPSPPSELDHKFVVEIHRDQEKDFKKIIQKNFNIKSKNQALFLIEKKVKSPQKENFYSEMESLKNKKSIIKHIEPNHQYSLHSFNDSYLTHQWNLEQLNMRSAWNELPALNKNIIAMVDSGTLPHSDINPNIYVDGFDFVEEDFSDDSNGLDSNPEDSSNVLHGLHMEGTAIATQNNNQFIAGINNQTKIMPLRVVGNEGVASHYSIIQAIKYAAQYPNDSQEIPENKADIINLSLGNSTFSAIQNELLKQIASDNILVIASAGNDNTSQAFYPAAYNSVIGVSSTLINQAKAPYSNYGNWVDVSAPGGLVNGRLSDIYRYEGVLTLTKNINNLSDVLIIQGTSISASQVSAIAALMKGIYSNLNLQTFSAGLQSTLITDDIGVSGKDTYFGHGLINASKAINYAQSLQSNAIPSDDFLIVSDSNITLFSKNDAVIHLYHSTSQTNRNNISLTLNHDTAISVEAYDDTHKRKHSDKYLKSYLIQKKFSASEGYHRSNIRLGFNNLSQEISVVSYHSNTVKTNFPLKVLLVSQENQNTQYLQSIERNPNTKQYDYNFEKIDEGNYLMYFGVDLNNDQYICQRWEPCGFFHNSFHTPLLISIQNSTLSIENRLNVFYRKQSQGIQISP